MRILVLTNHWPRPDRPARGIFTLRQVEGVIHAGVDADAIVVEGDKSRWDYLRKGLAIVALNLRRSRYDLIHAHTGHCGVLAVLQLRYPVVVSYVGYDLDVPAEHWEGPRTKVERFVFRQLSRVVAATIAKSARGRTRIPRRALARNAVIPNGVDRELFRPMPQHEARARLGWDEQCPVVLFAADPARFTKRFELARRAVELARQTCPELRLLIGDHVPPIEMPLWMNAADVLVLTSVAEGSPNVVKEAMACNLPVVAVDVGDVRDVIDGALHCAVCEPDPRRLADALLQSLAARPERSDGRERTAHLGLEEISRELLSLYDYASRRGPGLLGFLRDPRKVAQPLHPARRSLRERDEAVRSGSEG